MDIRSIALKNILKKKMIVEDKAEKTLSEVLKIEKIRDLFVECKMLIVEIAKLEVLLQPTTAKFYRNALHVGDPIKTTNKLNL